MRAPWGIKWPRRQQRLNSGGIKSQRPDGSLYWVFPAFEPVSWGRMRCLVLHKFRADLEPASCFSPCWINVPFSRSLNMKYIKNKLKTGQCFLSNAMGIFVFKSSFSTPQIFPVKYFSFLFFFEGGGRDYFSQSKMAMSQVLIYSEI